MNKQQVELAVGTGLQVLGDSSDIAIPAKHNDGVFFLKQLLNAIATGQLALQPTMQEPGKVAKPAPSPTVAPDAGADD